MNLDYYAIHAESPWAESEPGKESREAVESQERINVCMSCPLKDCKQDSLRCKLNQMGASGLTKNGKLDKRAVKSQEYMESLERLRQMILNGGTPGWICRELGISRDVFRRRRMVLVRMGWLE